MKASRISSAVITLSGAAAFLFACVGDSPASNDSGATGTEGQPCFVNGTCVAGLACLSNVCVRVDGGSPDSGDTGPPDTGLPDADAGPTVPNSCAMAGDGRTNCGTSTTESCCTSLLVAGGSFSRSYDNVSTGYMDPQYQATVASFRLDRYEVTVGRFRKFVDAVVGGWTPAQGSGKHTHLNGGSGLAAGGVNETGWDTGWNVNLPSSKGAWDSMSALGCFQSPWTSIEGVNEKRPIGCVDWHQAAAFCIWDGGFLPSEAEWNYASARGNEQRVYPWSNPPTSATISAANAVYSPETGTQNVGSKSPAGDSAYGQSDLSGNAWEWVLDFHKNPYNETSCLNCAFLTASTNRVMRGGSFALPASYLVAAYRNSGAPTDRYTDIGIRCARSP